MSPWLHPRQKLSKGFTYLSNSAAEAQTGIKWEGRTSSVVGVVHGRITLLTYRLVLPTPHLKPECLLAAAQQHSPATAAVEGNCPAEGQLPLFPVVFRDSISKSAFPVGSPEPHIL